jgi:hypothetical protein
MDIRYHLLGDADTCYISQIHYQQVEPTKAFPIFERRLWREDEGDQSILSIPKQFLDAQPIEEVFLIIN